MARFIFQKLFEVFLLNSARKASETKGGSLYISMLYLNPYFFNKLRASALSRIFICNFQLHKVTVVLF